MADIRLIVGLGNPGPEYENTRHNAGEWFLNQLADTYNAPLKPETKFFGKTARITIAGKDIRLLYPTTFMNKSGQAGEDVHTNVPLHFVNEEKSAAVKAGGIAEHHVTEIEVTCQPKDLPEFIEVDMAAVEMGQTVHLSDLTLPAGVSSVELAKNDEAHDLAVVTVKPAPKAAETDEDGEEAASEE